VGTESQEALAGVKLRRKVLQGMREFASDAGALLADEYLAQC
jgi:hypothetical protein